MKLSALETPPPGLYSGILAEEYHRWRGASQSRLKLGMERTWRRVQYQTENPEPSTPSQVRGSALHVAVLQPTLFDDLYPKRPPGNANSNAYKAAVAAHLAEHPFATYLTDNVRETVLAAAHAVRAHPYASVLLGRNAEHSAVWIDPATGVTCKGRLDDWDPGFTLVDLKSTTDASEDAFRRSVWEWRYHVQAAFYLRGARELGLETPHFTVIAIELEEPYDLAIYRIHEQSIALGDHWLDAVLPIWQRCVETDTWPSYPPKGNDLSLLPYHMKQQEDETTIILERTA